MSVVRLILVETFFYQELKLIFNKVNDKMFLARFFLISSSLTSGRDTILEMKVKVSPG